MNGLRVRHFAVLGVLWGSASTLLTTGVTASEPAAVTQPASDAAGVGFWPTERLVEGLLRRWAAAAAATYELSPEQHDQLAAQLLERWPKFLNENRTPLEPLLTEYLEARLAAEPPTPARSREWAGRGLPQLEKLRRFIEEGNDQFAALLTPVQRAKFDAERAKLAGKLGSLQTRLQAWEQGAYRAEEWWDLTRPRQSGRGARPTTSAAAPDPADEFAQEMAAWDRFVGEFVERYHLDAGQRTAAESILAEMKARAGDHYHSRRLRIAALEELIRFPTLETTETEIEAELIELYGPIDEMFRELEGRLRLIPTEAQKRRAEEAPTSRTLLTPPGG